MSLVALVDHRGGRLEAVPDLLALLLGHGAVLLPLFVEFLELVEGVHDILVLGELLGRLAEGLLGLEVLSEVKVAKVAAYLHHVVKLLDIELVAVVDVPEGLGGHGAGLPPAVLYFAEGGELRTHVVLALDQGLEVLDDGLLLGKVGLPLLLLLPVVFGPLLLVVGVESLEVLLDGLEGVAAGVVGRNVGILALEFGQELVERGLDGLRFFGTRHAVGAVLESDEHV